MKSILLACLVMVLSGSTFATLPDSIVELSRKTVLNDFINKMTEQRVYYKIVEITTAQAPSTHFRGKDAVYVMINFNDSNQCSGRIYAGQCDLNPDEVTITCEEQLTDCPTH